MNGFLGALERESDYFFFYGRRDGEGGDAPFVLRHMDASLSYSSQLENKKRIMMFPMTSADDVDGGLLRIVTLPTVTYLSPQNLEHYRYESYVQNEYRNGHI